MRLWSIHPRYLDRQGLVALWREALLAQKVLKGETKGYRDHPQLRRFRNHPDPQKAIAEYLEEIWKESQRRGYRFDRDKIGPAGTTRRIPVTSGQLRYEYERLLVKLECRDPGRCSELEDVIEIAPHPIFKVELGEIEEWEKVDQVMPDTAA